MDGRAAFRAMGMVLAALVALAGGAAAWAAEGASSASEGAEPSMRIPASVETPDAAEALAAEAAASAKPELPWERAEVKFGFFLTDLTSEVRVDSKDFGVGAVIDIEDALGLAENTRGWRVDAFYRLGRRHRVHFTYFDISRDARKALEVDIHFGDETFTVGTLVDSLFDLSIYKAGYSYSFFQTDKFDVSASLGLYLLDARIGLAALRQGGESTTLTAPLPVFGLRAAFAFTPKLMLKQYIELFYLAVPGYSGSIIDADISLEYNLLKYVGLGIGYNFIKVNINADDEEFIGSDFLGRLRFDYGGLKAYLKIYF